MVNLHPYLLFTGNCREAMTFYQRCLGGELSIMSYGESPGGADMPAETRDNVLHAMLSGSGVTLMGSDQPSDIAVAQGGPVTLALASADRDEIRAAFDQLADGGTVTQPLMEAFFGLFGMLTDRFGFNWMFQAGQGPS